MTKVSKLSKKVQKQEVREHAEKETKEEIRIRRNADLIAEIENEQAYLTDQIAGITDADLGLVKSVVEDKKLTTMKEEDILLLSTEQLVSLLEQRKTELRKIQLTLLARVI